ncbi:FAD:protein FMN transferase [candidate division WOR-3 bacterium]|nr:FAD:protein FMN transferase [candidate division WOR-3 bacterium]
MRKYFIIVLIIILCGCGIERKFDSAFLAMGNIPIQIAIYSIDDNNIEKTVNEIKDSVNILDSLLNKYSEKSPIYDFNNNNIPIAANIHIDSLINYSLKYKKLTNGLFDIRIETVLTYYRRSEGRNSIDNDSIKYFTELIANNDIYFDSLGFLRKDNKDIMIDFGGIAKGYIGELIKRIIRENGFKKAIIDLGGDIVLLNDDEKKPFRIGIRKPNGEGIVRTIEIMSGGVMTSGDYFRFYEINGIKYCHIINPKQDYQTYSDIQ